MTIKNKIFTPAKLKKVAPDNRTKVMVLLSGNYFKVANELREFSNGSNGKHPNHYYVFPSVISYMAAVEAYFLEMVALSIERATEPEIIEALNKINTQSAPYKDFKSWVRAIYKLHDPKNIGIDTNSDA